MIEALCVDTRTHRAKRDLIEEGDRPDVVFLLLDGWACRYKVLPDGRRRIVAHLVPGDLCDVHIFILRRMDHSIGLISNARAAAIPREKMLRIFDDNGPVSRALRWSTLTDEAVLREGLIDLARGTLHIPSVARLMAAMRFEPNYLHLDATLSETARSIA